MFGSEPPSAGYSAELINLVAPGLIGARQSPVLAAGVDLVVSGSDVFVSVGFVLDVVMGVFGFGIPEYGIVGIAHLPPRKVVPVLPPQPHDFVPQILGPKDSV